MKTIPAYLRIKNELKDEILSRRVESLSESKIIQDYRVSVTTSRRVLNELEDEGFVERRIGIGSVVRKDLFEGSREYGLIFSDMYEPSHPYISGVLHGMEMLARKKGDHLHLYTTRGNSISRNKNTSLYQLVARRQIDGFFVLSPLAPGDIKMLKEKRIPFVCIGNEYEGLDGFCVLPDYRGALGEVTAKAEEFGYRRIAFILGPCGGSGIKRSADIIKEFYAGYCRNNGKAHDERLCNSGNITEADAYGVMKEFHRFPGEEKPDVLIVSYRVLAGVEHFLEENIGWKPLVLPMIHTESVTGCENYLLTDYRVIGETAYGMMGSELGVHTGNTGKNTYVPIKVVCSGME